MTVEPGSFPTADDFFKWQPKDANWRTVPLARRIEPPNPLRMLVGFDMGKWSYWLKFDANPQGGPLGNVYNFKYWQYVDMVYYMPGTLARIPPAVWTNAAHRNGVKICAVVLRPEALTPQAVIMQTEFDKLFKNPKAATQLHLIAQTYGFDGWMIDIEEWPRNDEGEANLQKTMRALCSMKLLNGQPTEAGYYEAHQFSINDETYPFFQAGTFFQVDYPPAEDTTGYPKVSYEYLDKQKETGKRFATYWSVYVYNYQDKGQFFNGYQNLDINGFFNELALAKMTPPDSGYYQSIGIYAPDWTMYGGHDATKDPLPNRDRFHETERLFWVGDNPTIADDGTLKTTTPAVSNFIAARSSIVADPFVTRFNTGEGSFFAIEGTRVANAEGVEWNYLSAQDRLPTWLVPVSGPETTVSAGYSYTEAFDGGSSLAFQGKLAPGKRVEYALFHTDISLQQPTVASFIYMLRDAKSVLPYLKLIFSNGTETLVPGKDRKNGWVLVRGNLQQSLKLVSINLGFVNESPNTAYVNAVVGQLAVRRPSQGSAPSIIPTPKPWGPFLTWSAPDWFNEEMWYYNIFFFSDKNVISFVGRTFGTTTGYNLSAPLFPLPNTKGDYRIQPVTKEGYYSQIFPG